MITTPQPSLGVKPILMKEAEVGETDVADSAAAAAVDVDVVDQEEVILLMSTTLIRCGPQLQVTVW
jgi:hypothetical protein